MKKNVFLRLSGLGLAGVVAMTAPAAGHPQTRIDPDDTPAPVDVVVAQASHRRPRKGDARIARFRVVAYETWSYEAIAGDKNFVAFEIDLDRDAEAERCLVVRAESREESALGYSATIFDGCDYVDDRVVASYGTGHVNTPDAHSLVVSVPVRKLLGRRPRDYRWRAVSSYQNPETEACHPREHDPEGGYGACTDFTSWKRHRRL